MNAQHETVTLSTDKCQFKGNFYLDFLGYYLKKKVCFQL